MSYRPFASTIINWLYRQCVNYPPLRRVAFFFARFIPRLLSVALAAEVRDRTRYYAELNPTDAHPRIYFDVTHLVNSNLKTGIQRVVLSLYQAVKREFGASYEVCQVYLCYLKEKEAWHFCHYDPVLKSVSSEVVVPGPDDIFLGVDLNALIIKPVNSGLFKDWKRRGVRVGFFVHDILPIEHPEWWPVGADKNHELWLRAVLNVSTHVICVSETTLRSVQKFCADRQISNNDIVLKSVRLGSDLETLPSFQEGLSLQPEHRHILNSTKTFTMVGTIEPRKAHEGVLDAFELLWDQGTEAALVFVGKHGWQREQLIQRIENHPLYGSRLLWLRNLSDEALGEVYSASNYVVQASFAEGFGLPIVEAMQAGKRVIARDIPIFREILGSAGIFFAPHASASELAEVFQRAIENLSVSGSTSEHAGVVQTWSTTAIQVAEIIGITQLGAPNAN